MRSLIHNFLSIINTTALHDPGWLSLWMQNCRCGGTVYSRADHICGVSTVQRAGTPNLVK